MDYEKLLKKAKEDLPKDLIRKERFEVPNVKGHIEGNKTIITNFVEICSVLNREPNQLLKYLQRELATPANIEGRRLILGRKISSNLINEKVKRYAEEFVICKECGKPDTKLIKEDRVLEKKCMACGAKHPVRSRI